MPLCQSKARACEELLTVYGMRGTAAARGGEGNRAISYMSLELSCHT